MRELTEIKGLGKTSAIKLNKQGINTISKLLTVCKNNSGRDKLVERSGVSKKNLLNWLNRADLSRVNGIDTNYAHLLEIAGVDTVPELAQRNAASLYKMLVDTNRDKSLVLKVPTENKLSDWIEQAKELPRKLVY